MKKILFAFALLIGVISYSQQIPMNVLKLKSVTTAQRDALTIGAGEFPVIYNSTAGEFQRYNGATWETWSPDALTVAEIDTYAELNAIVADVTLTHNGLIDTFAELDAIVADATLLNASNIADGVALIGYFPSRVNAGDGIYYQGYDSGVSGRRWRFGITGTGEDNFSFEYQDAPATTTLGTYTELYKLNESGVPTDATDIVDKAYSDSGTQTLTNKTIDGDSNTILDVSASEVNITDAGALITATDVEGALAENRAAINLNTAKVTNATHTGEVTGATALTIASGVVDSDNIVNGTIDETDLDASVNASLDLADSSIQSGDSPSFVDVTTTGDLTVAGGDINSATSLDINLDTDNNGTESFNIVDGASAVVFSVSEAGAMTIPDGAIEAADLEATNSPTDGYFPSYDSGTGGVTWEAISGTDSGSGYTFNTVISNTNLTDTEVTNGGSPTGKKIWSRVTTNATITIDNDSISLTGNPFILQNWDADSTRVEPGPGTTFYFSDQAAAMTEDGFSIKAREAVTGIKMDASSYWFQGNITKYTLAPTNYYTLANSANPDSETLATTGISQPGSDFTISSVSATPSAQNGSESIKFVRNTASTGEFAYINLTGIPTGTPLTITMYVYEGMSTAQAQVYCDASAGWSVTDSVTSISTGSWQLVTLTVTASSATPVIWVYSGSGGQINDWFAVDNITIN